MFLNLSPKLSGVGIHKLSILLGYTRGFNISQL